MGQDRFETLFKLMDAADVASNEMLNCPTKESIDKFLLMNKAAQNECKNQLNQFSIHLKRMCIGCDDNYTTNITHNGN